ncbi:MAG: hypothetical protein FWE62_04475 [Firmicutes bacterium]|nr:hypothetical protein [Bacillota bacterium]
MIDFDKKLESFTRDWIRENAGKFKPGELEEKAAQVCELWASARDPDLSATPLDYVRGLSTEALAGFMRQNFEENGSIPFVLTDEMQKRPDAEGCLRKFIERGGDDELTATCINILSIRPSIELLKLYLSWLPDKRIPDSLLENVFDVLAQNADRVKDDLIKTAHTLNNKTRYDYICDALTNISRQDDAVFELFLKGLKRGGSVMFYCACLRKYGDERAVEYLKSLAAVCDYADFLEIRSALQSLGSDVDVPRDFSNDESFLKLLKK